jgi:hypothetical protein
MNNVFNEKPRRAAGFKFYYSRLPSSVVSAVTIVAVRIAAVSETLPNLADLIPSLLFQPAHLVSFFRRTKPTISFHSANADIKITVDAINLPVPFVCSKGVVVSGVITISPFALLSQDHIPGIIPVRWIGTGRLRSSTYNCTEGNHQGQNSFHSE